MHTAETEVNSAFRYEVDCPLLVANGSISKMLPSSVPKRYAKASICHTDSLNLTFIWV